MIGGMEARVSTRGRVTIPIELRRRLGIRPDTRLIVREVDGQIVVMTMASYVESLLDKYRGKGSMQALKEDRQYEAQQSAI
jgi:AbrB family looped-hinge helix DNA binding protein